MRITPSFTNTAEFELEPGDRVALLTRTGDRVTGIKVLPESRSVTWSDIVVKHPQPLHWGWFDEDDRLKAVGASTITNVGVGDSVTLEGYPYLPEPAQHREAAIKPVHPLLVVFIVLALCSIGWAVISSMIFVIAQLIGMF